MADKEWSTNYPTTQDSTPPTTEQPTLVDGEDNTHVSQIHALRDKLDAVCKKVGDDSGLPTGSLLTRQESIYVGKHGDDENDGASIERAFLTFTAALATATPGDVIVCLDNGTYIETLTIPDGVNLNAPNAQFQNPDAAPGEVLFAIVGNSTIKVGTVVVDATLNSGHIGFKYDTAGSGSTYVKLNSITIGTDPEVPSALGATGFVVSSNDGVFHVHCDSVIVNAENVHCFVVGDSVGGMTSGNLFLDVQKIDQMLGYGSPTGTKVIECFSSGSRYTVWGRIDYIHLGASIEGAPPVIGIDLAEYAEAVLLIGEIAGPGEEANYTIPWNVPADATLHAFVGKLHDCGLPVETGTVMVTYAGAGGNRTPFLTPTDVKVAAYDAAFGDFVQCEGEITVTLPTPTTADLGKVIAVKAGTVDYVTIATPLGVTIQGIGTLMALPDSNSEGPKAVGVIALTTTLYCVIFGYTAPIV